MSWWWCCKGSSCDIASDQFEQGSGNPHGWDVISGTWAIGAGDTLECTASGIILAPSPYVWPSGVDIQAYASISPADGEIYRLILDSNDAGTSYTALEYDLDIAGDCEYLRIIDQAGVKEERYIGNIEGGTASQLWIARQGTSVFGHIANATEEYRIAATTTQAGQRSGLGAEVITASAFGTFGMQRISGSVPCLINDVEACSHFFNETNVSLGGWGCGWDVVSGWAGGGPCTDDYAVVIYDKEIPNQDYIVSAQWNIAYTGGPWYGKARVIVDYVDEDNYHCFESDNQEGDGAPLGRKHRLSLIKRTAGVETVLDFSDWTLGTINHDMAVKVCGSTGVFSTLIGGLSASTTFHGGDFVGVGTGDQSSSPIGGGASNGVVLNEVKIEHCDC